MFPLKPGKLQSSSSSKPKGPREAHTAFTTRGMGDYYGRSMKNPMGKLRGSTLGNKPVSKSKLGKPPKSTV